MILFSVPCLADDTDDSAVRPIPDSRERIIRAVRIDGPITIDGRLDEADWLRAEPVSGFIQDEPFEGSLAMQDTEVRILFDGSNLYIGARMYDSDPSRIARRLTRRGETGRAVDYFEFSFDPNRDRTTGYQFRVTAAAVQRDAYLFNDTSSDTSWNSVWESATSIDEHGWTAEIRLPLSQLRFEGGDDVRIWGVDFARRRVADNERSVWAWVPRGTPGGVSRFGQLHGLAASGGGRYVEFLPYIAAGFERAPVAPGNPFTSGRDRDTRVGADVRYALGSTFMLDAALNPDFGQVEVDPQVINLGASETFFQERRPFFSRDDRMFQYGLTGGQNQLFHSRRIGRRPQGRAPVGAGFISMPGETDVVAATKVTGRTGGGLSVGLLGAQTAQEHGLAYFPADDEVRRFDAEPRTRYGIVSLAQDLREGQTRVGGIVTILDRDLPANGSLNFLTSEAYSGLINFDHSWADRQWRMAGHYARSLVRGSEDALLRIQRSSVHYHQRPDQDYLTLDPDATRLTGSDFELMVNRNTRNWNHRVVIGRRSPGFEVNDLGFYSARERVFLGGRVQYSQPAPTSERLQRYSITFNSAHSWRNSVADDWFSREEWSDAYRGGRFEVTTDLTFRNWWGLRINSRVDPSAQSDGLTRGGPLMTDPSSREYNLRVSTDDSADMTWNGWIGYSESPAGGHQSNFGVGVDTRPLNGLRLNMGLSYNRIHDTRQYVSQFEDAAFAPTFGRRYFFADVDREELSVQFQVSMIFSPRLSLELFVRPLISAADFGTYKQLARARSFEFLRFSEGEAATVNGTTACVGGSLCREGERIHIDYSGDGLADISFRDQNFNVRSLRGNAVLRWEYMPGSRLYVVWQHQRQERALLGDFDFSRDGRALLSSDGEDMFMIKVDRLFMF